MAFEIVEKGSSSVAHSPMTISITKSGFSIGSDISEKFRDYSCAEIYLDIIGRRVGFLPTNNTITGFKVAKTGKSFGISASKITARLPLGKYTGRFDNDGMIVIDVLDIANKS